MKLFFLMSLAAFSAGCKKAPLQIVLFHTSEIQGRIDSRDGLGGFPALARVVAREERPHLLLDAGEWFHGTPEGMLSRGQAVVELMNAVGYDAACIGNRDYTFGRDNLRALITRAKFPVLAANIYEGSTGRRPDGLKPCVIKELGGLRVGILGLFPAEASFIINRKKIEGLTFRQQAEEAEETVAWLRKNGADVVIALSHAKFESSAREPFPGNKFLAENVPGIDLIVGGNCPVPGVSPWAESPERVPIVCTDGSLRQVGRVTVDIDPARRKVKGISAELIALAVDRFGEDPRILDLAQRWLGRSEEQLKTVLGRARDRLFRDKWAESALGDWVADCMRRAAKADIALLNSGSLRADMVPGEVTRRTMFEILPFDDAVVAVALRGGQIRGLLENSLSNDAGVLQVSGLRLTYDAGASPGKRLATIRTDGGLLDDEKTYSVATVEFLATGGDGFLDFGLGKGIRDTGGNLRAEAEACVRKGSPVTAPKLGRMKKR